MLRDSFAGINSRFHLVGFYTLSELLLYIVADLASRLREDDPLGDTGVVIGLVLFCLTYCGVRGLAYHAATGRKEGPGFLRYSSALLLPFLWVGLKVAVLVGVPAVAAAAAYGSLGGPGIDPAKRVTAFFFYASPFFSFAAQALALYAMPLSIVWRERGSPRHQIREGLRIARRLPGASLRLLVVLLLATLMEGAMWYLRGPAAKEIRLDIPFAMVLFATAYLELVVFFGATRVVLARIDAEARAEASREPAPTAPGPPA